MRFRDFTFHTYKDLLKSLSSNGYEFQTFTEFLTNPAKKVVILRHDSDIWPKNDLQMAIYEFELNIRSTYFFRVPETLNEEIAKQIVKMNHEIGYHFEDLVRAKGNEEKAKESFEKNLNTLRKYYPVRTCSRHGRPLSKIESLDMLRKIDYKNEFNLLGEVYLDIDYSDILYLTDNGSRWNAHSSNIRDVVQNSKYNLNVRSTFELIEAVQNNRTPDIIILNCHPARWNNNYAIWIYRFFFQKCKNIFKQLLKRIRN